MSLEGISASHHCLQYLLSSRGKTNGELLHPVLDVLLPVLCKTVAPRLTLPNDPLGSVTHLHCLLLLLVSIGICLLFSLRHEVSTGLVHRFGSGCLLSVAVVELLHLLLLVRLVIVSVACCRLRLWSLAEV